MSLKLPINAPFIVQVINFILTHTFFFPWVYIQQNISTTTFNRINSSLYYHEHNFSCRTSKIFATMKVDIQVETVAIFFLSNLYQSRILTRCMPWLISFAELTWATGSAKIELQNEKFWSIYMNITRGCAFVNHSVQPNRALYKDTSNPRWTARGVT